MPPDKLSAILATIRSNPVERHEPLLDKNCVVYATIGGDIGDVNVVRRIGLGTHAEVYEVAGQMTDNSLPVSFAMKVEKPIKQAFGILQREIAILRSLSHLNCVPRVLGEYAVTIDSTDCFAFGLEQFNGSLSMLKQSRPSPGDMDVLLPYLCTEMFKCVSAIHEEGILHRDLKPSNFMFKLSADSTLRIALIDFGSAVPVGVRNETEFRGTGAYLPIDSDPWESTKIDDLWALAFTLLDLAIVGGLPWRSTSARSAEGRAEIRDKKIALMGELDMFPSFLKTIFLSLQNDSCFCTSTLIDESQMDHIVYIFATLMRPAPKDGVAAMCFSSKRNHSNFPSVFAFSPPTDPYLRSVASLVSSHQRAPQHMICISQLLRGRCELTACPLRHYERGGIVESAVNRRYHKRVCVADVLTGNCRTRDCSQVHLSASAINEIYGVR